MESIGSYFSRRYGMSSTFLRFGLNFGSYIEDFVRMDDIRSDLTYLRKTVDDILKLPEREARQEVRSIENAIDLKRREAMTCGVPYKNGTEYVYDKFSEEQRIWNYYVHNFLMYLDRRDIADGIIAAMKAEYEGSHNIFIADHKNMLGIETADFAALLYPGARIDYTKLIGYDSVVDYRETEDLIGWRAKYTLADYYDALYS